MNSSFFKPFFLFFILILCLCLFFIPVTFAYPEHFNLSNELFIFDLDQEFVWPIPEHTNITSPFGKRPSPTLGASTYHKGIDIGAPEGTKLYAVCDGEITFTNFLGGGGYTITLTSGDFKFTYCHVSANFFVSVGTKVSKGEYISNVGPKYVYNVPNNPYKDKNGNPTNGATTRNTSSFWSSLPRQIY